MADSKTPPRHRLATPAELLKLGLPADARLKVLSEAWLPEMGKPYAERLKTFAKRSGIDYRTPPFPPGDRREYLRLSYLEMEEAEYGHALERTSPAKRAAALKAWNEGDPRQRGVTLAPWERTQRIGRTVFRWRGEAPPARRTARDVDAWFRLGSNRATILDRLCGIYESGSRWAPDALAVLLVDFRDELISPEALRTATRANLKKRFGTKYKSVRAFGLCLERGRKALASRGKVSRRKPRSRATKSTLA